MTDFSLEQQSSSPAGLPGRDDRLPWESTGTASSAASAPLRETLSPRRFPRAAAERVIDELRDRMRGTCTHWEPAGSFRRGRPDVGDIEIVYVSSVAFRPPVSELIARDVDLAEECIADMLHRRVLVPRPNVAGIFSLGSWNKLLIHPLSGIPIDLFRTREECWFNYLVCRTGSAENNIAIARAAIERGLTWQPYTPGFWDHATHQTIPVHSEQDAYRIAGLPYKEPRERN